jgi:hypothetical protein
MAYLMALTLVFDGEKRAVNEMNTRQKKKKEGER